MTIRSLALTLGSTSTTYEDVWHPDVFGSALFLIASWIAWHPIARSQRHHLLHGRSRLICLSNMLGSDLLRRVGGEHECCPMGPWTTTRGTTAAPLLGALCFLVGALALRPTSSESRAQGSASDSALVPVLGLGLADRLSSCSRSRFFVGSCPRAGPPDPTPQEHTLLGAVFDLIPQAHAVSCVDTRRTPPGGISDRDMCSASVATNAG